MWAVEHDSTGFSRMVTDWRRGFSLQPQGPGGHPRASGEPVQAEAAGSLDGAGDPGKFHQTQRAILDGLRQHVEQ